MDAASTLMESPLKGFGVKIARLDWERLNFPTKSFLLVYLSLIAHRLRVSSLVQLNKIKSLFGKTKEYCYKKLPK